MMAEQESEPIAFQKHLETLFAHAGAGDALQKIREQAWNLFVQMGLPTKNTEAYRYFKMRHLLSHDYQIAGESAFSPASIASLIQPECQDSFLVFVNGRYSPTLSCTTGLPNQIAITPLPAAMHTYGAFLRNHWTKSLKEEQDPFALLNSALHRDGAFVYVPPKTIAETPLQILHLVDATQSLITFPRLQLFVGSQSQLKIILSQNITGGAHVLVNQLTEMFIEEDAHVHVTQVRDADSSQGWHFDALRATLKKNATLKTVHVSKSGLIVRQDARVALIGENAEALLNGVWMLEDKHETHTNILMDHQAPSCRSYQLFKGVLRDVSRSCFEGKILVRQAAQKTEAFQMNNNLLLGEYAHADSKPNLEIFADDVKASHGATFGQLDADQLFYMKSRGLPESQAQQLLVRGFCEQVTSLVTLPSLKQQLSKHSESKTTQEQDCQDCQDKTG